VIDSDSGLEARFTLERERGGVIDEPPFRILVLGNWSGDAEKRPFSERRPIEIDRDNFDDLINRFNTRLDLEQPDGGILTLEFQSLDDFHPDQIFERLPLFSRLRELRSKLLSPDTFDRAAGEVRSWFKVKEPAPAAEAAGAIATQEAAEPPNDLLDAILTGSSVPAASVKRSVESDEIAALIRDLVRPHLVSIDENEQAALLAAVDAATSDLMRRILHDHKFQALEAAWRGLYLLVRRTETGTDLKIYILDAGKDEIGDDLRSVGNLTDAALYKLIVEQTVDTPGADPWAVIVADHAYTPNKDDIASLMRIAKICSIADAPFISHMRPDVLGISSLAQHPEPREWRLSADSSESKLWTILRGIPEATYLGMTMPRFLARLPYGGESDPVETFQFEEFDGAPDHDRYLWANSSFIAGLLMANSFSAYAWEMDHRFLQDIERLPMHMYEASGETIYQPCAEVLLTQNACERLMEYGLMPLVSYKNSDHVKLARFQSISDPITALRGRWSH
jgi:type VI secretion system protein ImpC